MSPCAVLGGGSGGLRVRLQRYLCSCARLSKRLPPYKASHRTASDRSPLPPTLSQGITLEALPHAWTTRTPSSPLYTSDGHIDDCEYKNTLNVAESNMAEPELGSSFIPALHKPSALLPIAKHRQSLLYLVETRQVTIVVGQTGSGKTTQIPQFLEKAGWCANGKVIAVTQVGPCPSLLPDISY